MGRIEYNIKKDGSSNIEDKNIAKLAAKGILDKVGFGFGSQQFINIMFFQTGASLFLVGLVNSFRVIFGSLTSFFVEKSSNIKTNKKLIGVSGITFGFSFLLIAVAIYLKSAALFALAILISSVAIVFYSEANAFFKISSSKAHLIEKIIKYSLVITAISLFIAAYLMDRYPSSGTPVLLNIFNNLLSFKIYGYLIVFEIAAISFILAGYILSKVTNDEESKNAEEKLQFNYVLSIFAKNKALLLLVITNIIVSLTQTIGYSYYGIFIYKNFNNVLFGGFLNVAMVFLISVFTSLIGYFITKINAKVYRKFPILIFGIIMVAFMPFAYFFKPNLLFITIGTIIGVIGSSAVGVINSLLVIELIDFKLRQAFFSFINLASIPIFLVIAPILAYIAQVYGLNALFLLLAGILVMLIVMLLIAFAIFKNEVV